MTAAPDERAATAAYHHCRSAFFELRNEVMLEVPPRPHQWFEWFALRHCANGHTGKNQGLLTWTVASARAPKAVLCPVSVIGSTVHVHGLQYITLVPPA